MRVTAYLAFALLLAASSSAMSSPRAALRVDSHAYTPADYVRDFARAYTPEEAAWRLPLLSARLARVAAHNAAVPPPAWRKAVNELTDRSDDELRRLRGVAASALRPRLEASATTPSAPDEPDVDIDWRGRGVITAVKNQAACGSCWAFAAVEAVEAAFSIATGRLENLSEQQILDCTPNPLECGGDGGCTGGTPELAYEALMNNSLGGGLASEWTYPYVSAHGDGVGPCKLDPLLTPPVARVTGYMRLPSNDQAAVLAALRERGPLAVNVDAGAWFEYGSGVFTDCDTESPDIDHAVLLVGAGTDNATGLAYWLVRNSWGTAWGEGAT